MSSFLYLDQAPLERMKRSFDSLPDTIQKFQIAFSGGLDSCVLLHATQRLFPKACITAIHINHGIHSAATYWAEHCQSICDALKIPIIIRLVSTQVRQYKHMGYSPEDAARKARYTALSDQLNQKDCLLTGHHLEDQAETVLLQLMRGAGVQGLGGMRLLSRLGSTYHLRPILYWTQKERLSYAKAHQLTWIEDPSNHDQTLRRNFIRHTIFPVLQQKWPQSTKTLGRSALHAAEASDLCTELAISDLATCSRIGSQKVSISALLALSVLRRRNTLRYFLYKNIGKYPSATQFAQIEKLLYTPPNGGSTFCFYTKTLKRYQDNLLFLNQPEKENRQYSEKIEWPIDQPMMLPDGRILTILPRRGKGIRATLLQKNPVIEVRFRQGGERFHPHGRIGSHPLKKLFQEWAIPPWQRYQWPLIYYHNQLIAIPHYAVSHESAALSKEEGLWISIQGSTTISV